MRNGTDMYFDSRFIPTVLENGAPGITLILEDATERHLAKKASIERDRLLHTIFQIPTAPQFYIDRNHKVVYWDRALEILTGIKAEEVVGTSDHWRAFYAHPHRCLADLLVDGDMDSIARQFMGKCSVPAGVDGRFECTDFFPDMVAGGKWLHITAALIHDTTGRVTGAMETLEDVSDRKKGHFVMQK
jgi:PAS domain-containing protein